MLTACGDDGGAGICYSSDVHTWAPSEQYCPVQPKIPADEGACVALAVPGTEPRIGMRADGLGVRAWRDGDQVIAETTGGPSCGARHGVPSRGAVRTFEVAIDDVSADVAWHDDAGVWVMVLADDGTATSHPLPGVPSLAGWIALGDGRRVSLPGPAAYPVVWRGSEVIGTLGIIASAGDLAYADGKVAVVVDGGGLQAFDVSGPSAFGIDDALELDLDGAGSPSVAWLDGDIVVAWQGRRDERDVVRVARVEPGRAGSILRERTRVLVGPVELESYGPPRLATTALRVMVAMAFARPGDLCGGFVWIQWLDTALRPLESSEQDIGAALDDPGADVRVASDGTRVVVATTRIAITRDDSAAIVPSCASPMFTTVTEDRQRTAVIPGVEAP